MASIKRVLFDIIVYFLVGLSSVPALASANKDVPCDESLTGTSQRMAGKEGFALFNGSQPIPLLKSVTFTTANDVKFSQETRPIGAEDEVIAKLMRDLRALSIQQNYIEQAAMLFIFHDSPPVLVQATSGLLDHVSDKDMRAALLESGIAERIKSNPKDLKQVIHFHTHPPAEELKSRLNKSVNTLLINETDYLFFVQFSSWLASMAERTIPLSGIVIPTCDNHNDAFFITRDVPTDPKKVLFMQMGLVQYP